MRIALLEDDPASVNLLIHWLEADGYRVWHAASGKEFVRRLARESFDLLILDWMVPELNGEQVLAWIRSHVDWPIPVLFTTSRDSESDIVRALENGADDYMIKPLRRFEFAARVNALARRSGQSRVEERCVQHGIFRIDRQNRSIVRSGEEIALTRKEYELACFLFANAGRILSRGHIFESVWGHSVQLNTRTLDSHVSRIRQKLGLGVECGWVLTSIYQHGYRLESRCPDGSGWEGALGGGDENLS